MVPVFILGFVTHRRLLLKPGSVPSIFITENVEVLSTQDNRKKRVKTREDKRAIDALLQEADEVPTCILGESIDDATKISSCQNCDVQRNQIEEHRTQMYVLRSFLLRSLLICLFSDKN